MSPPKPAPVLLAERILELEAELRLPDPEDNGPGLVEVESKDWEALVRLAKEALGRAP